ncbi:hypothetical protein [Pseudoponticoccus marisrubri]|uniref:Uncharacterized protein n=1 Tax=Pseudoponticoccus marisrubri TaxID=1685382 RepID=A0A0W7WEP7_9RHOB|nr:hypothetical protein [Pseudoponticoccus marisrubri]KUF09105.1 hypothetical protein AVJ23_19470 [Pseudoponticoccus marisrubri]
MPRWLWFAPLAVLLVAVALFGFRQGWIVANLTETDVIEAMAARYLAEAGPQARASDCVARPGREVWLVVACGGPGMWEYRVDRLGRLKERFGPGDPRRRLDGPRT